MTAVLPAPSSGDPSPTTSGLEAPLPARRELGPPATFLLTFAGLTTVAILCLVPWYRGLLPYEVALSVAHVVCCCLGAAWAIHRGLRPCLLVASIFPFCWLAVASVYQISHGIAAWGDPGVTDDVSATLKAQGIIALGQASLLLGYLLETRRTIGAAARWSVTTRGRRRLVWFSAVFLLLSLLLLPVVISAAGGVGALFSSREGLNQSLASNGYSDNTSPLAAVIKILPNSLCTSSAILAIWLLKSAKENAAYTRQAKWLALPAFALLFIVANPFAFTRVLVLSCFGPVFLMWFQPRRRRAALLWLFGTLFAFLLAYPAADKFRAGLGSGPSTSTLPVLASKDFDGFQQAINTVTYVQTYGLSHGIHILSGLLIFVPRAVWSGKAQPASITIAEGRGYNFTNLSMPLPAEAYLDLGWVGLVVFMAALGYLWGRLDRGWLEGSRISLLAAYMAMAQVGLWRGPLGSQIPFFGFAIFILVLATTVSARRPRPSPGDGLGADPPRRTTPRVAAR